MRLHCSPPLKRPRRSARTFLPEILHRSAPTSAKSNFALCFEINHLANGRLKSMFSVFIVEVVPCLLVYVLAAGSLRKLRSDDWISSR